MSSKLVVGLDGDDTLWHCQRQFDLSEEMFAALLAPFVADPSEVAERLMETERRHLAVFGYGVKAFTLSMIETAIDISDGAIPGREIQRLIDRCARLVSEPVELFEGVAETVAELAGEHRLVLVTKGDLMHQEHKIESSGLAEFFDAIEVVSDKTPETYRRVLRRQGIAPDEFVMVGDSVRSDVLPVLEIGGRAVHVPHSAVWSHEIVDHDHQFAALESLRQLPGFLREL